MDSLSIFGPSVIYAAFTGVLLWASSLTAAWAGNWFACHHIGEALEKDRRLIRVLGTTRSTRFAQFWDPEHRRVGRQHFLRLHARHHPGGG